MWLLRLALVLLALVLLAVVLLAPVSSANPLRVLDSLPAEGTVDVPLEATIVFRFNQALSVNTRDWNTAVVEPRSAVRIVSVQLCVNLDPCGGSGEPRYVRYVVQHAPDTDFTWLFFDARTASGQELAEPYMLNYSTGPDVGPAVVSGELSTQMLDDAMPTALKDRLAEVVRLAREPAFGPAGADLSPEGGLAERLSAGTAPSASTPHTRVLLLDDFTVRELDWTVRAATVLAPGHTSFSILHVREGTYWPLVVQFTDATSTEIDAIGYLDGGDGEPISLEVTASGVDDVVLTLYAFPLRRATEGLAASGEQAARLAPDPELVLITGGYGLRPSGRAYAWGYTYRSLATGQLTTVEAHALGTFTQTHALPDHVRSMHPIDDIALDSDRILEIVMEDGGEAFLQGFTPLHIRTEVSAGHQHWLPSENGERPFWRVVLRTVTTSRVRTMQRDVDMASGFIVDVTDDSPLVAPARVYPNYPNPFNDRTRISFSLVRATDVRVEVFDLKGRRVALLLDAALAAGAHEVDWRPAGLAAGVYVCRLTAGDAVLTGRMLAVR
jgi:hypothetical protein